MTLPIVLVTSTATLALLLGRSPAMAQSEAPKKYAKMIAKAREFLAKNQRPDGHWEGEAGDRPVAMTGLVGMALFMDRQFHGRAPRLESPQSKHVWAAVGWLEERSRRHKNGLLLSGQPSEDGNYMQGHALATLFLAGVLKTTVSGDKDHERIDGLVRKAADCIVTTPSNQGGWFRTSKLEGHDLDDVLTSAIAMQALQATGRDLTDGWAARDAERYLKSVHAGATRPTGQRKPDLIDSAATLACLTTLQNREVVQLAVWLKELGGKAPAPGALMFGRDELFHYYFAQALFNEEYGQTNRDKRAEIDDSFNWWIYRDGLFDLLARHQNSDGSWPAANDRLGRGSVYATALWCTILQLDNNRHPASFEWQIVKASPRG